MIQGAWLAAVAVIAVLALRRRHDLLVALVLPVVFLTPVLVFGRSALSWGLVVPSTTVMLIGLVAAWLLVAVGTGEPRLHWSPALAWALPYAALVAASVIWSALGVSGGEPEAVFREFVDWLIGFGIFGLLAAGVASTRTVSAAVESVALTLAVVLPFTVFQALAIAGYGSVTPPPVNALVEAGRAELWFGSFRLYGTFPHLGPNNFGVALLLPATLCLARADSTRGFRRAGWMLGLALAVGVLAGTFSRGAQLGFLVAAVSLLVLRRRWGKLAIMGVAIVGILAAMGELPVVSHARSLWQGGRFDADASARIDIWREVLEEIPDHPVGFGFNGWQRASRTRLDKAGNPQIPVGGSHPAENQWIRELADRGIAGPVALAAFVAMILALTWRGARQAAAGSVEADWLGATWAGTLGHAVAFLTGDHLMYLSVACVILYFMGVAGSVAREAAFPPA
jgi:O-antigen ligase